MLHGSGSHYGWEEQHYSRYGNGDSAGILDEEFGAAESGSGQKPGKLCAYCGSSGQKGEFVYEISLARAETGSSGGTVGTFTVVDERSDVKVCGAIRPRNVLEYDSMVKEQQERWEEWFRWQQGSPEAQREIAIQTSAPKGQVAGRVWIRTY